MSILQSQVLFKAIITFLKHCIKSLLCCMNPYAFSKDSSPVTVAIEPKTDCGIIERKVIFLELKNKVYMKENLPLNGFKIVTKHKRFNPFLNDHFNEMIPL